jgi:hypothetical protein
MKRVWIGVVTVALSSALFTNALAHKPSDSYLGFTLNGQSITGRWDIAIRDLDFAVGLDTNDDGLITWGELKTHQQAVTSYALSRLTLKNDGVTCTPSSTDYLVNDHTDGRYVSLGLEAVCATTPTQLEVGYALFADIDPQHRGLLNLTSETGTQTAVLGPDNAAPVLEVARPNPLAQFVEFVRQGVLHIWEGIDHILFLLALLFPSVLRRDQGRWVPVLNLREAFFSVLKIVTAFTLAHSVTLTLASLEVISLPSRLVESVIAASVVLAALNNVFPVVQERRRWLVAFGFGLIHGFGFASVLADLGLPKDALVRSLVGFNVGVELGQLAIVLAFLPLAFVVRQTVFYKRFTIAAGSLMVATIAAIWMAERVFDFKVLPI